MNPSPSPTSTPSLNPSPSPTDAPTMNPSPSPTPAPTMNPSPSPTDAPTMDPSPSPTLAPTQSPTCIVCNFQCGEPKRAYQCASQSEARQVCESNGLKLCSQQALVDYGRQVCAYMYTSSSTTQGMYVGFGTQGCGKADQLMKTPESYNGVGMFDAACCPLDTNEGTRLRLSVVEKSRWNWNPADVLLEQNGNSYPLANLLDGSTSSFWYGVPD